MKMKMKMKIKQISPELKNWIEIIEKSLLIISTSIMIITATYNGASFLKSKTKQADAQRNEIKQRISAIDNMTSTYTQLLSQLDNEIKNLDNKMSEEIYKDSVNWKKYSAIRDEKVKDRNSLLNSLGNQIVQLKEAERTQ